MNKLYFLGNQIGNFEDVPQRTIQMLESAALVIYEHKIRFDDLIKDRSISISGEALEIQDSADFNLTVEGYLENGHVVAITDAGYPLIADMGWSLGRHILSKGYEVSIIPGPSISSTAQALTLFSEFYENFIWLELLQHSKKEKYLKLSQISHLPYNIIAVALPHEAREFLSVVSDVFKDREVAMMVDLTRKGESIVRTTARDVEKEYENIAQKYDDIEKHFITIAICGTSTNMVL